MAGHSFNVAFTRDEAILALDVLYFSGEKHFSPRNKAIIELSQLMNELPIHPMSDRPANFRNPVGMSDQIGGFRRSIRPDATQLRVGSIFYVVFDEYRDNLEGIHEIAQAIKRNKHFYTEYLFGNSIEADGFKEGILLGHLHKLVEQRDSVKINKADACEVCHLNLGEVYRDGGIDFLQMHLLEPVTKLDAGKKYSSGDFITVCPNCHAMLHRHRPWATKETIGDILR